MGMQFKNIRIEFVSRRIFEILCLLFILAAAATARERHTVSGYIRDADSGEELIGVTVYAPELKSGCSSNVYGFYSLTMPDGPQVIRYSIIGYEPLEMELNLSENIRKDVELKVMAVETQDVTVTAEMADENIKQPEMSMIKMNP
jgi:hypothetical protein